MNPFFDPPDGYPSERIPPRAYGKIEHIEISDDRRYALFAIDLIDADWFDQQDSDSLIHFTTHIGGSRGNVISKLSTVTPSPFDLAPLYRLEVETDLSSIPVVLGISSSEVGGNNFDDTRLARLEVSWFEFASGNNPSFGSPANLYASLYTNSLPIYTNGTLVNPNTASTLASAINLNSFPRISPSALNTVLSRGQADFLAVYDVGQGNCNGLLDSDHFPTIYFDLGAGVFRNAKTTPGVHHKGKTKLPLLKFCFTASPPIILSHWDADHWAGAFATKVNGDYPALDMGWVAPDQQITILHYAFALEILSKKGSLSIYNSAGINRAPPTSKGYIFEYWCGCGSDRNGTGIVLNVIQGATSKSWLLTGDCDYDHFPVRSSTLIPVAIVAPHHGAKLLNAGAIPSPVSAGSSGYNRLLYSFGPNNTHGKYSVSHPRQSALQDHNLAGWSHSVANIATPGSSIVGGRDVRGTAEHSPGTSRGGILVSWTLPSKPMHPPCGAARCSGASTT